MRSLDAVRHVELKVGLEVHVELACASKLFTNIPNPAAWSFRPAPDRPTAPATPAAPATPDEDYAPNTLIDPVVLALPGALPVLNREAVELSIMVGLALNCRIASTTKWDRKSYFYPDLPKAYQISQYDLPVCYDGSVELPPTNAQGEIDFAAWCAAAEHSPLTPARRVGIIRAHLEEDAGKLLHELPSGFDSGGAPLDGSIIDFNRAGTPLLEIVTQPEFTAADDVVAFAQMLRHLCRFIGASEGVMQKGHMRFEPNINTILTLADGRRIATPVVEVKNLNSFKAVKGAIEFELREQPARWARDGREFGRGMKVTRGWDDARNETFIQREKEDADDYRYFPDPDLPAIAIDEDWVARARRRVGELPILRARRFVRDWALPAPQAAAMIEEPGVCALFEQSVAAARSRGVEASRAARACANLLLQNAQKRANERTSERIQQAQAAGRSGATVRPVLVSDLGLAADSLGALAALRESGSISAQSADELLGHLCDSPDQPADVEALARDRGMLIVRDDNALASWCEQAIRDNAQSAADVRAGKLQAVGRLVGAVMKLSGGAADAAQVRERLLSMLK